MFYAMHSNTPNAAEGSLHQSRMSYKSVALSGRDPFFLIEIPCDSQGEIVQRPMLLSGLNEIQLAMAMIGKSLDEISLSIIFHKVKAGVGCWECEKVESIWHGEYHNHSGINSAIRVNLLCNESVYLIEPEPLMSTSIHWNKLL